MTFTVAPEVIIRETLRSPLIVITEVKMDIFVIKYNVLRKRQTLYIIVLTPIIQIFV